MSDRDPPRLLDDPSVPADLRSTLQQAAQHTPPIDTAAGLAQLEAAMHAPAAAGGGGTVALAVAAAVVIGGAAWLATRPSEPSEAPGPPPADAPLEVVAAELDELPPPEPPVAAPAPATTESDPEEPTVAVEEVRPAARAARPRVEPEDDSLARDMAQLVEARRALVTEPARALALVEAGRREFPRSLFAEERDAIRVLALARLERGAEAARLGRRFLAAHPSSPFAERVRRAIEPAR